MYDAIAEEELYAAKEKVVLNMKTQVVASTAAVSLPNRVDKNVRSESSPKEKT